MDTVLLVDRDRAFIDGLRDDLNKLNQFHTVAVYDGEEAAEYLRKKNPAVLVTEIDLPGLDGLELLALVTREFPSMPCIVASGYGRPWFFRDTGKKLNLYYLEKPLTAVSMVQAIMISLSLKDEGSSVTGFFLRYFLPLIELDGKTCRLKVQCKAKGAGFLYFEKGVLIDAHYNTLTPDEVVREIIDWGRVTLTISELPRRRVHKRLRISTIDIVGASWKKEDLARTDSDEDGKALVDADEPVFEVFSTEPSPEERGPAREEPAEERGPAREEPAEERGPAREEPAEERGPAREEPAEERGPAREEPAEERGPAREEPAEERGPVREEPAEERGPVREEPAEERDPAREEPAEERGPAREEPAEERRPGREEHAEEEPAEEIEPDEVELQEVVREELAKDDISEEEVVRRYAERFIFSRIPRYRAISGYRAIGVTDAWFRPLAGHNLEDELSAGAPVADARALFQLADWAGRDKGLGKCDLLMESSPEIAVHILNPRRTCLDAGPFFLIAVTETDGDWESMKKELDELDRYLGEHACKDGRRR